MSGQAVELTATARLLDGRLVSLRRLGVDDTEAVVALHQHLSDHDRYYRFFTLNPVHLDQLVGKLIEPTNGPVRSRRIRWKQLIGVANYTVSDDPNAAEIGVVVAHEDHSLGVGTALLQHLAQIAGSPRDPAISSPTSWRRITSMIKVFFDFGWPCEQRNYGSVLHLDIELPNWCRSPLVRFHSEEGEMSAPTRKHGIVGLRRRIGGI